MSAMKIKSRTPGNKSNIEPSFPQQVLMAVSLCSKTLINNFIGKAKIVDFPGQHAPKSQGIQRKGSL